MLSPLVLLMGVCGQSAYQEAIFRNKKNCLVSMLVHWQKKVSDVSC